MIRNIIYTYLLVMSLMPQNSFSQINSRPNIVFIFSDDHAQQAISAYGSNLMKTPNIDRIAYEGAILKNAFVTNSICAPSRAVLLTGKFSHINGLKDNSPRRLFDGSQQQVQKLLQNANYQTAWVGKWHLQSYPQGFDYWKILPDQGNYYQPDFINMTHDTIRYKGYVTNLISDFSFDWLRKRDTLKPFFLVIGEKATHRNWMPAIEDLGAYDQEEFKIPDNFFDTYQGRLAAEEQDMTINKTMLLGDDLKMNVDYKKPGMFGRLSVSEKEAYSNYYKSIQKQYEQIKNDSIAVIQWKYQRYLKDYLATAKSLDRNIGRILNYLDSTGLSKNTIVIYASDQGFYLGEHGWFDKRFMYEESVRTPFVIKYPTKIKPGTKVDKMVQNIDFAPTLLDMVGIHIPNDMQGKSFFPMLKNTHASFKWRDAIYYHYYEYPEPHRVAPHFGIRTQRYKLIRFYGPHNEWELYDLTKDPHEMNNMIHDHSNTSLINQLKSKLIVLIKEYKDDEALEILKKEPIF
jgi:arylsulfatase A-like enzyme